VHGQVSDLGKVTQQAYSFPLSVVMGKELNSVVVDSPQVARECITYLTQRKLRPLTFLPLATVKCSEPSERLRQLGGTAKLAVDLVEFDEKFKRAFYSACG
jgi:structural maintenance of chromosome 1